jgi:uncharacterized membrane protein
MSSQGLGPTTAARECRTAIDDGATYRCEETRMSSIIETVDVDVPVRTAYDQWTQFEEFPVFMEGVESVRQLDDTHLEWTANVAGKRLQWRAEISEQTPDQRIAWHATEGATNAGVVTFHRLDDERTRVTLQLDVEPEGAIETIGDALGMVKRRVAGDLGRFKEFIEGKGAPSGAWRGEVEQGDVVADDEAEGSPTSVGVDRSRSSGY